MTSTKVRLWTVDEYHRMIEAGILTPSDRVELIEGKIVSMAAKNPPHAATNLCAADYLKQRLADKALVRIQDPIQLSQYSEPEPDLAIVAPNVRKYIDHHPRPDEVLLLIEVADTSLQDDRTIKAPLYAKAGILEYWILDVNTRQVYVFRDPQDDGYAQEVVLSEENTLTAIAFPELPIALNQLFP
jgi:Uma2 family endonuclease